MITEGLDTTEVSSQFISQVQHADDCFTCLKGAPAPKRASCGAKSHRIDTTLTSTSEDMFKISYEQNGECVMRRRESASILVATWVGLVALSGCGGETGQAASDVKLQGAGASFPAPLYNKWFKSYSAAHQNVLVDYQSVGSGSGVKSVVDHTVDFGASDAAMRREDAAKVDGGVQLFPMTAGSIVLAYNLKGVDNLKLSRRAYSGVFLGTIKRWNDPSIVDERRRHIARFADQRRGPRRQQRNVVRLLQTSQRDQR
ncbi:MAG: hypothetical protein C5B57_10185 [Blastocatellia bacterium]|nr:MAG: hypothetical protein C5B57_10185 [Blastocatellia bacterium]